MSRLWAVRVSYQPDFKLANSEHGVALTSEYTYESVLDRQDIELEALCAGRTADFGNVD